MKVLEKTCIH